MARGVCLAAIVIAALLVPACSAPRDPIIVDEGMLVLENQTSSEWRNVRITVNHHFRGGVPVLAAGGRMNAPLTQFETGFGQRFDRWRMSVFKVEVTATDAAGKPVTLNWGKP